MLRSASIVIIAFSAAASAQETSLPLDVSPTETYLGENLVITTRPVDRTATYRYGATRLSTTGAVIGTVTCSESVALNGSGASIKWTPPKSGTYQITIAPGGRVDPSKPQPSGSASVKILPQRVTIEVIKQPGKITTTVLGSSHPNARYKWSLQVLKPPPALLQTLFMETSTPAAIWQTTGINPLVRVDVFLGGECGLIASGIRQSI